MARQMLKRDIIPILAAAQRWIQTCLIEDRSIFRPDAHWTAPLVDEVNEAFVGRPDFGQDNYITKLKGQMKNASPLAEQLMAEMLWALLLFPSNMKARTKRQQVRDIWAMSGQQLADNNPLLDDSVLVGIGSGGPASTTTGLTNWNS
jgi:5-methylcytosine-specific restriction protein B